MRAHLSLLYRILILPTSSTSRQLLLWRINMNPQHGYSRAIIDILHKLDLPSIQELVASLPCKVAWKAFIRTLLLDLVHDQLIQESMTKVSL